TANDSRASSVQTWSVVRSAAAGQLLSGRLAAWTPTASVWGCSGMAVDMAHLLSAHVTVRGMRTHPLIAARRRRRRQGPRARSAPAFGLGLWDSAGPGRPTRTDTHGGPMGLVLTTMGLAGSIPSATLVPSRRSPWVSHPYHPAERAARAGALVTGAG